MKNQIALKPTFWASVSGGKDSLYMLRLILANLDKYPLDGVVHFELEIDYPFIKNVVDAMEYACKEHGIKFLRIKPRKTRLELYNKHGFPTPKVRWCNREYKLDAVKHTEEIREIELGHPFAVMSGNPKYNADYIDNNIKNKWYPLLFEGGQK